MNKLVALAITLAGAALVIGARNPIGEPNLHPSPWVVCPGAMVAAIGAYLLAFKVMPRESGFRAAGICVIVAMAALAPLSVADAASVPLGRFCMSEPLTTSDGDDLGRLTGELTLTRRAGRVWVSFIDAMPDTKQELEIGPVPAREIKGRLTFRFTDNWTAAGVGHVSRLRHRIRLTLDRTGQAGDVWGDNAGRNYGTFTLTRAACRVVSPS